MEHIGLKLNAYLKEENVIGEIVSVQNGIFTIKTENEVLYRYPKQVNLLIPADRPIYALLKIVHNHEHLIDICGTEETADKKMKLLQSYLPDDKYVIKAWSIC